MARVKFSVEQIIHTLREAEVLLAQGQTIKDLSPVEYYRTHVLSLAS